MTRAVRLSSKVKAGATPFGWRWRKFTEGDVNGFVRGWNVAKASLGVIAAQPSLMVLPVLSGIVIVFIVAGFSPVLVDLSARYDPEVPDGVDTLILLALLGLYLCCHFAVVFFNAALVFSAVRYFEIGSTSVGAGLAAASKRIPSILMWSVIAATVGLVIRVIGGVLTKAARRGGIGMFVAKLVTAGLYGLWITATYFALPVLVVEGVGPFAAARRSVTLIKSRWTDVLGGQGMLGVLAVLAVLLPGAAAAGILYLNPEFAETHAIVLAGVGATYLALVWLVLSILETIFLGGVYLFASTGKSPEAFGANLLQAAMKPAH
jgi:hypothetical protein